MRIRKSSGLGSSHCAEERYSPCRAVYFGYLNSQFLVRLCIRDDESLNMERRVGLEGQSTCVFALDVDEQFFVLAAEAVEQLGMHRDLELVNLFLMALHQGV